MPDIAAPEAGVIDGRASQSAIEPTQLFYLFSAAKWQATKFIVFIFWHKVMPFYSK